MIYLARNSRPHDRIRRTITFAVLAVIVCIICVYIWFPQSIYGFFTVFGRPFWQAEFVIESGSMRSTESLLAENESLKRQLADVDARSALVHVVETENAELRALLGRSSSTPLVLSAVLSRPPVAPYDMLVIDIGRDHKVSSSSLVYAPGNILMGKVVDVTDDTSKVGLFSSPGERFEVTIGSGHVSAVAVGRGGGQLSAELPRGTQVAEGDAVYAAMLGSKPFALVVAVVSDPAEAFETVYFAPPVNVQSLRWVLVDVKK